MPARDVSELLIAMPEEERRDWLRALAPDDAADVIQNWHWWRILVRECMSGITLGTVLCVIGMTRIMLWHGVSGAYGDHFARVALTVGVSLIGVVLFGTLAGAMLPLLLRTFRLDPASASAPAVATLVDVSGLIIYFSVAKVFILGVLR